MVFEREDKMHEHRATHERAGDGGMIRPFHCSVPGCGKAFTEKRNLNVHRRTKHTEVRVWLTAGWWSSGGTKKEQWLLKISCGWHGPS